eukprot:scpid47314/ scgid29585/ 
MSSMNKDGYDLEQISSVASAASDALISQYSSAAAAESNTAAAQCGYSDGSDQEPACVLVESGSNEARRVAVGDFQCSTTPVQARMPPVSMAVSMTTPLYSGVGADAGATNQAIHSACDQDVQRTGPPSQPRHMTPSHEGRVQKVIAHSSRADSTSQQLPSEGSSKMDPGSKETPRNVSPAASAARFQHVQDRQVQANTSSSLRGDRKDADGEHSQASNWVAPFLNGKNNDQSSQPSTVYNRTMCQLSASPKLAAPRCAPAHAPLQGNLVNGQEPDLAGKKRVSQPTDLDLGNSKKRLSNGVRTNMIQSSSCKSLAVPSENQCLDGKDIIIVPFTTPCSSTNNQPQFQQSNTTAAGKIDPAANAATQLKGACGHSDQFSIRHLAAGCFNKLPSNQQANTTETATSCYRAIEESGQSGKAAACINLHHSPVAAKDPDVGANFAGDGSSNARITSLMKSMSELRKSSASDDQTSGASLVDNEKGWVDFLTHIGNTAVNDPSTEQAQLHTSQDQSQSQSQPSSEPKSPVTVVLSSSTQAAAAAARKSSTSAFPVEFVNGSCTSSSSAEKDPQIPSQKSNEMFASSTGPAAESNGDHSLKSLQTGIGSVLGAAFKPWTSNPTSGSPSMTVSQSHPFSFPAVGNANFSEGGNGSEMKHASQNSSQGMIGSVSATAREHQPLDVCTSMRRPSHTVIGTVPSTAGKVAPTMDQQYEQRQQPHQQQLHHHQQQQPQQQQQ